MASRRRRGVAIGCVAAGTALVLGNGCGTTKVTGTARTGTEQLLLTDAWDRAVREIDFKPLAGVPVYLDPANVAAVDQGWVVSSIRQCMAEQGVLLRPKADEAQWIVEARVGAYGTDESNFLIGVPQVNVPQTVPGVPSGTIPEMPLVKRSNQKAVAKLALFAYERKTGRYVWSSGTMQARSNAKDVYVGGMGPFQTGTLRDGPEFMDLPIPIVGSKEPPEDEAPANAAAPPTVPTPEAPAGP